MKIFIISILFSCAAQALPAELFPRLDRALIETPAMRDSLIADTWTLMETFCEMSSKYSPSQLQNVRLEALESCRMKEVLAGLEDSERELKIKIGQPLLHRINSGTFSEDAAWRYLVRSQMLRRWLGSLRIYFSQGSGSHRWHIEQVAIPLFAASLDHYSYWTRLLAMKENMICSAEYKELCRLFRSQIATLAQLSWAKAKIHKDEFQLNEKNSHLDLIANNIKSRLSKMKLTELMQLEKMDNVTSAGLGIPYFRQLLTQLNLPGENLSLADQQLIRKSILIKEIRDALAHWSRNTDRVEVSEESVAVLSVELKNLARSKKEVKL